MPSEPIDPETEAVARLWSRLQGLLRGELGLSGRLALHEPLFDGSEARAVLDCLESGWVSTAGPAVDRLEGELASLCGVEHAFAANSGTSALHLALLALGVGPGDLVICPAISFVATANAIRYCGAEPLFADVDGDTLCLAPDRLTQGLARACARHGSTLVHVGTGRPVCAVIAMHAFGHPADMDTLMAVTDEMGLPLLEDAAEAIGSLYRGKPCGGIGRMGILSFNGNKIITTGAGGAVLTNDAALARRVRHLGSTARLRTAHAVEHDEVGYNYRMPSLNAALGSAQLARLPALLARKRALMDQYRMGLSNLVGVQLLEEQPWVRSNFWLAAALLDSRTMRDDLVRLSQGSDIELRPCWTPLPDLPMYRESPCLDSLEIARDRAGRLINLPSGPGLTKGKAA